MRPLPPIFAVHANFCLVDLITARVQSSTITFSLANDPFPGKGPVTGTLARACMPVGTGILGTEAVDGPERLADR
jgi:hypothetical protein